MGPISRALALVKFSHSIFALPFALASLLIATQGHPSVRILILVIAAMVTARTSAMAFNRWADADLDAANPRTQNREIPAGLISRPAALVLGLAAAAAFLIICSLINRLALILAPVALAILLGYSYSKRFSSLTHLWLGLSLGISPVGAWIAATGRVDPPPLILGLGVMFWVAGFDIIYATQDYEHDRTHGLRSLVVRLGLARALALSRLLHMITIGLFFLFGVVTAVGWSYHAGTACVAAILIYEQCLVRANDLSKVNQAFFTVNGVAGLCFFLTVAASLWL